MSSVDEYSTYEAKARFSEVLRRVREGRTVTVTYHGGPRTDAGADRRPAWRAGAPPATPWPEIERVLGSGYIRAADAWHLATALYLSENPEDVDFVTLDERQRASTAALG